MNVYWPQSRNRELREGEKESGMSYITMDDLEIINKSDGHTRHLNQIGKKEKREVLHTKYGE